MQSGCFSQPEHSCIYLCTHLQLLHLSLKHLLPEFMEDVTMFPGWIRAVTTFLFLNFSNFLAAVSNFFYLQSHIPHHSSSPLWPSGLASPSVETAALWHHVLPTFPSSTPTSSLHFYLALLLVSLPSLQLSICSFPPSSALQMLPCFLCFCLLEVPHFPLQTLQKSCCIFKAPPDFPLPQSCIPWCVLPNCPAWLWHHIL